VNAIAAAPTWLVWAFAITLVAAALEDALRLRISNVTCAIVLIGALIAISTAGWSLALWQNFALLGIILVVGTGAFSAGLLGGGDVKLLAAIGLWVDLSGGLLLISAVFLAGGVVAIGYIGANLIRGRKTSLKSRRVPYGIAIAIGTLITIAVVRHAPPAPNDHSQLASGTGSVVAARLR